MASGYIELISKIKPKNNGTFAMVDASDVEMPDGKRLSEVEIGGGGSVTKTPTSIDLTNYASSGEIVEHYADGSTVTHTITFEDGKPTKIQSGDTEIDLTW